MASGGNNSFHRTFSNIFGDGHPALVAPAGLSSGQVQRAADRWTPCIEDRYYAPGGKTVWQPALPVVHGGPNMDHRDVPGNRPSSRPILATSHAPPFNTRRCVSPLEPRYNLPHLTDAVAGSSAMGTGLGVRTHAEAGASSSAAAAPGPSPTGHSTSSNQPLSRSLDTSDIDGARRRSVSVPLRGGHRGTLDIGDIMAAQRQQRFQPWGVRPTTSLMTEDIRGATPAKQTRGGAESPGCGTLRNDDIRGARPGVHIPWASPVAVPMSFMMGRWPAPAAVKPHFATSPRRTVLQKPLISVG